MDRTDTEMIDSDIAPSQPPTFNADKVDDVRELLTAARQLVNQGQPSQALQAVIMAVRSKGGDNAVLNSLQRTRELYINRLHEHNSVDHLASLFAECAIAEAEPLKAESPLISGTMGDGSSIAPDAHRSSILAETGRDQLVLEAFSDGSSFICLQCGGLVSIHRKDEHYAYWCCKI